MPLWAWETSLFIDLQLLNGSLYSASEWSHVTVLCKYNKLKVISRYKVIIHSYLQLDNQLTMQHEWIPESDINSWVELGNQISSIHEQISFVNFVSQSIHEKKSKLKQTQE